MAHTHKKHQRTQNHPCLVFTHKATILRVGSRSPAITGLGDPTRNYNGTIMKLRPQGLWLNPAGPTLLWASMDAAMSFLHTSTLAELLFIFAIQLPEDCCQH